MPREIHGNAPPHKAAFRWRLPSIAGDGVTFRAPDGTLHDLKPGNRMLERLDLAYALTVRPAQGMTATNGILVMREEERRLNSTRSVLVATTYVTDNLTLIVDNARSNKRAVSATPGTRSAPSTSPASKRPFLLQICQSVLSNAAGERCFHKASPQTCLRIYIHSRLASSWLKTPVVLRFLRLHGCLRSLLHR